MELNGVYFCEVTNKIYIITDIENGIFENGAAAICTYENEKRSWKKVLIGPEIIKEYFYIGDF